MEIKTNFLIIRSVFYDSVLAKRIENKLNKKNIILKTKKSYRDNY